MVFYDYTYGISTPESLQLTMLRAQDQKPRGNLSSPNRLAAFMAHQELQAFFSPQALNLLVIDVASFNTEQLGDLPIAVSSILFGELDQRQAQRFVILSGLGLILLRSARHTDRFSSPPF